MGSEMCIRDRVNSAGANAKLGTGEYLVAEADESDASFLNLKPEMAVVTNIDHDHMSTYEGNFDVLQKTFVAFLQNLPFYGLAVLCHDDPNLQAVRDAIHKPIKSYGLSEGADIYAYNVQQRGMVMTFDVRRPNRSMDLSIELAMPGRHNVLNALAAIAVATHLDVSDDAIMSGLQSFQGIGRRFQVFGDVYFEQGRALLVDDYAHHPVELEATLSAARGCWPDRRIVVVFQPHRYSRTYDLFDDFVNVLADATSLVICEVYPAGEKPQSNADGRALCRAIRSRGLSDPVFVPDVAQLSATLLPILQDGDVVLTMGAGSIGKVTRELHEQLGQLEVLL